MRRKWIPILIAGLIVCGTGTYFLIRAWLSKRAEQQFPSWRAREWERLKDLNERIASNPDDWRARMYRADVYRRLSLRPEGGRDEKWMAKATQELNDAIVDFPEEGELYYRMADHRAASGDWEKAIEDCTTAINLGYDGGWVHARRAGFLEQAGKDLDKALEDIETAIRLSPSKPHLYRQKARLLRQITGLEPTWSPENEAIKGAWRELPKRVWRLLCAVQHEEPEQAREYWWGVRHLISDVSHAYGSRGQDHFFYKRYVRAVRDFCLAILIYERNFDAWEMLGDMFKGLSFERLALDCYFMAARSMYSSWLYERIADLLVYYRRYRDAAAYYTGALEDEWDSFLRARVYLSRARCLRAFGRRRAALRDFKSAVKAASAAIKPEKPGRAPNLSGYWLRGLAYYELGQRKKALADLEKSDLRSGQFWDDGTSYSWSSDAEKFLDELREKLR